jgi:regulator of protease activity HflC (stomatin/prohibitin superfamily)
VQAQVLPPGTHYLNPYMYHVTEVSLQSQQFQMSGEDAISFLTSDGFVVEVEGTLEFALDRDKAALLTHRVGDMEDVIKKIILPRARGFSRIEGSKQPATSFIMGETRQQFQNTLEAHLREQCTPWGVTIKSVLIRNIKVPNEIASVIRDRELAVQEARKFEQEIEQARSKAELTRQEMLALQNRAKVEADTEKIKAVIAAQQTQAVQVTNALRSLEVARLELESAQHQARAILINATGQMQVVRMNNEAEAAVLAAKVRAMKNGAELARVTFLEKVAPQVDSILTTDDSDGLGTLLRTLLVRPDRASPPQPLSTRTVSEEDRP